DLRDTGLLSVRVDPMLRELHSDPRYTALLVKMGLPLPTTKPWADASVSSVANCSPDQRLRYMTNASTSPSRAWRKAFGILPTISNPCFCHSRTAPSFVLTTKLNCIAVNPAWRACASECSHIAPAIPWPRPDGDTMSQ